MKKNLDTTNGQGTSKKSKRGLLYRGFTVPTQRNSFRFHLSNYSYSLLSLLTGF